MTMDSPKRQWTRPKDESIICINCIFLHLNISFKIAKMTS